MESLREMTERLNAKYAKQEKDYKSLPICEKCGKRHELEPCESCLQIVKDKKYQEFLDQQQKETQKTKDIKRLGGVKPYEDFTIEKYDNKSIISECSAYPQRNLFLWGKAGTGKTHLATAIIRQFSNGIVYKPQRILRECRFKNPNEEQSAIDKFINLPNILIDDLGVDKSTGFSFSVLYEILDGRDMERKNGLIITSNLSVDNLADRLGDDRICSRIYGMCKIIEITGRDWRI